MPSAECRRIIMPSFKRPWLGLELGGRKWEEIGDALGISKQAVIQRFGRGGSWDISKLVERGPSEARRRAASG